MGLAYGTNGVMKKLNITPIHCRGLRLTWEFLIHFRLKTELQTQTFSTTPKIVVNNGFYSLPEWQFSSTAIALALPCLASSIRFSSAIFPSLLQLVLINHYSTLIS